MAKLIFLLDENVIKEYVLDKERFTIGRRASNDVHIDNLAISGNHAVIVTKEDGVYIEDLNSTNGTVVNRQKIKKKMLEDRDLIKLGKYQLRYMHDTMINQSRHDGFEETVLVIEPEKTGHSKARRKEVPSNVVEDEAVSAAATQDIGVGAPAKDSDGKKLPRLQVLNGKDVGTMLALDKAIVKIGRPNKQLALVTKRTQGHFLSHVVGDNYPLVNGKPIDAHAYKLNNHDEIELLGVKMTFLLD